MIDPSDLYYELEKRGINFFTGVPDSLLKDLISELEMSKNKNYITAPNEGSATALAIGYNSITKKIPCSKKNWIEMVLDIEKYPIFVPFCVNAKIYEKKEEGDLLLIIADLTIGKGPFKDTYKSYVKFNKKEDSIFVTNLDGPLKHLENTWYFNEKNNITPNHICCFSNHISSLTN